MRISWRNIEGMLDSEIYFEIDQRMSQALGLHGVRKCMDGEGEQSRRLGNNRHMVHEDGRDTWSR